MNYIEDWNVNRSGLADRVIREFSPRFTELLHSTAALRQELGDEEMLPGTLAAVCSIYDGAHLILPTLRELVDLLKAQKYGADLFVVLNAGGGTARDVLLPTQRTARTALARKVGADEIITGKANLKGGVRLQWKPGALKAGRVRLILIDQQDEPGGRGKSIAIRIISEYLKRLYQKQNYCPQYMLMLDAETRLRLQRSSGDRYDIDFDRPAGLKEILDAVEPGRRLAGSRLYMTYFSDSGTPLWDKQTPPLQHTSTVLMGTPVIRTLNGGATAGDFRDLLAVNLAWTGVYPRCRIEDSLMCFMLRGLGIDFAVPDHIVHANHCPTMPMDAMMQYLRWRQGLERLMHEVGEKFYRTIYSSNGTFLLYMMYAGVRWPRSIRFFYVLPGILHIQMIDYVAGSQYDDWIEGDAGW